MLSPKQRLPPPRSGPSHSSRLSRWLSRLFHRTTTNPSTTHPVEVQQQESNSEQSASGSISSDDNTTITPGTLFRRHPCPSSFWRRAIRRARQGRRRNQRLGFDEIDPHRGFSPPRHRQRPDRRRQRRDDGGDWVSESSESGMYGGDRRIKESESGETSVRNNEGSEGGIIGVGIGAG